MENTNLLFNEPPLVVSPRLAKLIGLNEAIVLQQLHYWLEKDPKIRDDRRWVYNTYEEWLDQLPFRCVDTVKRTINKLAAYFIIIKGNFNKASFDKTGWYSIDYDVLDDVLRRAGAYSISANCTDGKGQSASTDEGDMHQPIPEITQRLLPKTTNKKEGTPRASGFDVLISEFTYNSDLIEALREFIKMRTTIKKPLTDRALKMVISKLKTIADTDEKQIAILNQSVFYCWQDIYPLKTTHDTACGGKRGGIDYEAEAAKWKK